MRGRLDVLGGKGLNLLGVLQDVAELATVRLQLFLREGDAGELGNLGDIDLDGHGRDGNQPDRHPRVTGTGAFPSHALAAGNVVNRMGVKPGGASAHRGPSRVAPVAYPEHKTKIVCTIGPASDSAEMLERLIMAGMNVARLNFSHGVFTEHATVIDRVRRAAAEAGRRVAIMADLPGPKIRIGELAVDEVELEPGDRYTLTTNDVTGDHQRVSVAFPLPQVLSPGDRVFLNDGVVELEVDHVAGSDVHCIVRSGGEIRSRKGLNLPGVDLGISALTERDRECLRFALDRGVDAISQSFVATASDIEDVREAARRLGHDPFIIAKIERAQALDDFDEILPAADGIMVARGDLGVEIPIEQMAVAQKQLIARRSPSPSP